MTNARTTTALAAAATTLIAVSMMLAASPAPGGIDDREFESVGPEPTVDNDTSSDADVDDPIQGVRVVTDHADQASMVADLVARFDQAGWPLTNTEIRFDPNGCTNGVLAFHAEEKGHHLVVMCRVNEYTLLHELGHVWSDLYLDDTDRDKWTQMRGLDSWHEGDWRDRGTEHVAQIIAFGLHKTLHVPMSISNNDYPTIVAAFEWLMDTPPLHRQNTEVLASPATTTQITVSSS